MEKAFREAEIAYEKGHKYLTIIRDLDLNSVIWVGLNRKKETLDEFFSQIGEEKQSSIQVIVSDMWDPYLASIQEYCPQCDIVFDKFHIVGHDRGVRVGLRLAMDHPDSVLSLTNLDVVPSLEAFENMDASLAFSWFHWQLMRQPYPLPETVFSADPKLFLDFFLDTWTAVPSSFTDEAYAEYLRCFSNPETVRAMCADYRGIALDLEHEYRTRQ